MSFCYNVFLCICTLKNLHIRIQIQCTPRPYREFMLESEIVFLTTYVRYIQYCDEDSFSLIFQPTTYTYILYILTYYTHAYTHYIYLHTTCILIEVDIPTTYMYVLYIITYYIYTYWGLVIFKRFCASIINIQSYEKSTRIAISLVIW